MPDTLPRLTKAEMARLVEIGRHGRLRCHRKPATTDSLRAKKLITMTGGKQWGNGWLILPELSPTDLGRVVLARLPEETH